MLHAKTQRLCAWSGIVCVTLFFAAFLIAGFIPVPGPDMTQEAVAAMYRQNANRIRFGMSVMMISSAFFIPLAAVISEQMKRIPGRSIPLLANIQLVSGLFSAGTYFLPALFFIVTAFRPERSPELTYLMNDLSFIILVIPLTPFLAQNFAFGIAVFQDRSPQPIFPRWLAWLSIWECLSFLTALALPYFRSGPFAWNGIFVFYGPAALFVVWYFAMVAMLLKAINRQEQAEALVDKQGDYLPSSRGK